MVMHKCYLIGHPDGRKFLQSLSVLEVEEPSFQVESGFAEEPVKIMRVKRNKDIISIHSTYYVLVTTVITNET